MFDNLFDKLLNVEQISNKEKYKENWSFVNIEGNGISNCSFFMDLQEAFVNLNLEASITFFVDNEKCSRDNLREILSASNNWRININKNVILTNTDNGCTNNFFYSKDSFVKWIKNSNPFSVDYFLNVYPKIKIHVNGLTTNFGGSNFVVCGHSQDFFANSWVIQDEKIIQNHIRILCDSEFIIIPNRHSVYFGDVNQYSLYFYRNSILVLLAGLCNEIQSDDNVTIRGFRRLSLQLGSCYCGKEISKEYQDLLIDAIQWIYSDSSRCDLRLKLLLERISLDINLTLPYIKGVYNVIEDATTQAKERFLFITYERKDQYQKELKDLLKDLKSISDLYSSKVRALLSNLLRDVLAAFILVGITLFAKTSEMTQLTDNKLIRYVFIAFGFYFIVSVICQAVTDVFDIIRSRTEFDYWKNITREYMSLLEFKKHKSKTINPRARGSIIIYLIIASLYGVVAYICFNFPSIWLKIIN
ncbi:MAG: hypothetical protein ACRCTQ_07105 [Brevinemataceae bacterium]